MNAVSLVVVSVVNVPGGKWGYVAPVLYCEHICKNGATVYRRMKTLPLGKIRAKNGKEYPFGVRSIKKAEQLAIGIAEKGGYQFVPGIRHNMPVPA